MLPDPAWRYDWPVPIGKSAWLTQKKSVLHLVCNPHSWDLSELRTGKTWASLWAADIVMTHAPTRWRALVVANLSTLRDVWENDIFGLFTGRRTWAVLHGTKKKRLEALERDVDFYIINHDGVAVIQKELAARTDLQIIIIDEAAAYRHAGIERHNAMMAVAAGRAYQWQLTGTPCSQGPCDIHGLLKLMHGKVMPYYQMRDKFMLRVTPFKWRPKAGANEAAVAMLRPAIRWRQEDVFGNVDIEPGYRKAELTAPQKTAMATLKRELRLVLAAGKVDVANEAALQGKFLQISAGHVYDENHASHKIDAGPRLSVLKEIVEESPTKVLVFSPLTNVNLALVEALRSYNFVYIGGSDVERREALRRLKEDPTVKGGVAHPGPIARGHDLTVAATIVWYLPTNRTEDFIQANERTNGPKQKTARAIFLLYATDLERAWYDRLRSNEGWQKRFLEMARTWASQ